MLKEYTSIQAAKRSLLIETIVLSLIVAAVWLAGRLMTRNVFTMDIIIADHPEETHSPDESPQIQFDQDGVSIQSMELVTVKNHDLSSRALRLSLKPEKPGDYNMTIRDGTNMIVGTDSLHVDPLHTMFSWSTGKFTGNESMILAAIIFFTGFLGISLVHFLKLKGALAYSYNAILAAGIFLFCLVVLLTDVPMYLRHLKAPVFYPGWQLLADIAAGGKSFALRTYPVMAIFSLLLIISNIELLRHERIRFQNLLGLLLGLSLIGGGAAFYLLFGKGFMIPDSPMQYKILATVENVLGVVITYGECILMGSMICALRAVRHMPAPDMDYILILGCGFRKDGTLPPLLRGRVDKAMEFWYRQKEKTGKEAIVIPSGGQGKDECMAESEAMSRYMIDSGFPKEAIINENQSANTYQNMSFSKSIIDEREGDPGSVKTAYVTTNYHVYRSGVWAGLAGLNAEGIGSRTKWWYWPNAFIRECAGLLRNRIVPECILLVLISVAFGLISYFAL